MKLEALRSEIDQVNEELISLFAKRLSIAKKIAQVKKRDQLPILDKERESEQEKIIESLAKKYRLSPEIIKHLFKIFVEYTKMEMAKS